MDSRLEVAKVRAWDLPTRLFHWGLVSLIVSAWACAEYAEKLGDVTLKWHRWTGISILVLLVWRVLWGFVGAPTSRFARFIRSPAAALVYLRDLISGRDRNYLGHNPLGAWMIVALLAVLAAQAGLGLFTTEHNDLASGPFARYAPEEWAKPIRRWHHTMFNRVLLPLIALHVLANVLYGLIKRDPLIRAMVTGWKPDGDYADTDGEVRDANLRALVCLVVATAIVLGGITALGGRL